MKRLALTLLSAVVLASPAFALVGGPWDANIPGNPTPIDPSSIDGTYQGTIKGANLAGIMVFATTSKGTTASAPITQTVITGTGSQQVSVTTAFPATVQGYAGIFFEGKIAFAKVDSVVDLGSRKISGIIQGGGQSAVSRTLTRPATATTPETKWTISTDSVVFYGNFDAKLSSSWSENSYKGKGFLLAKRVDIQGFFNQLITNPTTAAPQIVTLPVPIKVAGVKTSSTSDSWSLSYTTVEPVVTLIP